MSEIASEYGYETNPEVLEKIFVKTQTLDEKELAAVTGGNEEDNSDYYMPDNDPYEVLLNMKEMLWNMIRTDDVGLITGVI